MSKPRSDCKRPQAPNDQITEVAREFRVAFEQLNGNPPRTFAPFYMVGAFAIELYLKSLLGVRVYTPVEDIPPFDLITAESAERGHDLVDLYNTLPDGFKRSLDERYKANPVVRDATTLEEALTPFRTFFVDMRYCFEKRQQDRIPHGRYSPHNLAALVKFVGDYVEELDPGPRG